MNARTNIIRIAALAILSLPAAASAAIDAPAIDDIHIDGATCRDADDLDIALTPTIPDLDRVCELQGASGMWWKPVAGAAGYRVNVWGEYEGDGLQFVSSFDANQTKLPIEPGNADFYVFTIEAIDPGGQTSGAYASIGLRIAPAAPADDGSQDAHVDEPQDDASDDHADPGAEIAKLEALVAELEAELDDTYDVLHEVLDANDKLRAKNETLAKRMSNLRANLEQAREQATQLKTENGVLKRILRAIVAGKRPSDA